MFAQSPCDNRAPVKEAKHRTQQHDTTNKAKVMHLLFYCSTIDITLYTATQSLHICSILTGLIRMTLKTRV